MAQLPPSISGSPPPGYSPASNSSGNPGAIANAIAQVGQAVKLLQGILPMLPIGTEPHKNVLKMIELGSKTSPAANQVPGIQKTAVNNMQQQVQQGSPMAGVMQAMGQPSGMGGQPVPEAA